MQELEEQGSNHTASKSDSMKEIFHMVVYFLIVIAVIMLLNTYVVQQIQVDGSSMNDTLRNNDRLILEKLSYHFNNPERFDIIVFKPHKIKKYYIKRIIGLPGETVQITDGVIYINGSVLHENYGLETMIDSGIAAEPITLTQGEYFVLGDNRNDSKDSRDVRVGVVSRTKIAGRAYLRIWPLNKIKRLEHQ